MIIGDAVGRPLADELTLSAGTYDLSELQLISSSGAILSPAVKRNTGDRPARCTGQRPFRRLRDRWSGPHQAQTRRQRSTPADRRRHHHRDRRSGRGVVGRVRCGRQVGPSRMDPAGLLERSGQDGRDLPGDRRRPVLGPRRPRHGRGRRCDHRVRPRIGGHQLRRREDLPRGGGGGGEVTSGCVRRAGGRGSTTNASGSRWWPLWRPARAVPRRRSSRSTHNAARCWPGTRCPATWSWWMPVRRKVTGKPDYVWAREVATR